MKFFVLSVRDRAADVFGVPYFAASVGQAVRGFGDEVNRPAEDNQFYKHPEDFDLYLIGIYDDNDASFETNPPKQVAVGKDLATRLKAN